MSLIDSVEGARTRARAHSRTHAHVEEQAEASAEEVNLREIKNGEIIFDQNVEMQCTAGKQVGFGHLKLNCELQQLKNGQRVNKIPIKSESNVAVKDKLVTKNVQKAKKAPPVPQANAALYATPPTPKVNTEIPKQVVAPNSNVAIKQQAA